MVERGPASVVAVECKARQTVAEDWFAPLRKFCATAGRAASAVAYGGERNQPRSDTPVFGWRGLGALFAH